MAATKNKPNNDNLKLMSGMEVLRLSYSFALKSYEQVAVLFLIPALVSTLGTLYLESGAIEYTKYHLLNQSFYLGLGLIGLGIIWQLINYSPSIYFLSEATRKPTLPSIIECYNLGLKKYFKILYMALIADMLLVLSMVLFIFPFIIFFPRLILLPFFAAEHPEAKASELLNMARTATKPYFTPIWNVYLTMALYFIVLNLIFSIIPFGIVFISILTYVTIFMPVLIYRQIVNLNSNF